jgi:hypothetical protein
MQYLKSTAVILATFVSVSAQWLHYPTPGIPRTPDGRPNFCAPGPKTSDGKPDFAGIWVAADGKYLPNLAVTELKFPSSPGHSRSTRNAKRTMGWAGHPNAA